MLYIHSFPVYQTVNVALASQGIPLPARTQYKQYTAAVKNTKDVFSRCTPRNQPNPAVIGSTESPVFVHETNNSMDLLKIR